MSRRIAQVGSAVHSQACSIIHIKPYIVILLWHSVVLGDEKNKTKHPNPHFFPLVSYIYLFYHNCQFLVRRFSHRGRLHQYEATFDILKFSLAVRLRGHVYSFSLFASSRPRYQAEF